MSKMITKLSQCIANVFDIFNYCLDFFINHYNYNILFLRVSIYNDNIKIEIISKIAFKY